MAATVERLLDALNWFRRHAEFSGFTVLHCHPSTSSERGVNDLVLGRHAADVRVRCEVTDVASSSAGQNNKEAKDLASLGCENEVPADGVRRFIATSQEFAEALTSRKRVWHLKHYRYIADAVEGTDTFMLEVRGGSGRDAA